jgi:Xaa-Pro aminopeptidase
MSKYKNRRQDKMIDKFINEFKKNNIDGMLISNPHNVRYLSGYKGDDSYLLMTEKAKYLITDARYTEQAAEECPGFEIIDWKIVGGKLSTAIDHIAKKENIELLGIEPEAINYKQFRDLDNMVSAKLTCTTKIVEQLRTIKTPKEVEYIKRACEIGDKAFERILNDIKVGVTEKELSAKLAYYLKMEGSDARGYENILVSGKRTSLLHGIPSDKKVEYGDFVLMDFGAGYNGYLSDMTRTVVLGKANEKQKEIYDIEKRSGEEAISAIKAKKSTKEIYYASLKAMEKTEYIKYHYGSIGHGVGLAVHEEPYISPLCEYILEENNVITIEPGIYIPGWGGVRIEEQVLVTKEGCEILTNSPKQLIEI